MIIDVLTLFPKAFSILNESILGRAQSQKLLEIGLWDIREYSEDKHKKVDDTPYGGGPGMIMKPEPIFNTVNHLLEFRTPKKPSRIILFAPQGRILNQSLLHELSQEEWLILICGHYEGVDGRVPELIGAEMISIGDYVLTGGEPAAIVVIDGVSRLIPGVLHSSESIFEESFTGEGLLEYPQYTKPAEYRGLKVPEVLLSGNHAEIAKWRKMQSLQLTLKNRPDLLNQNQLELLKENQSQ
jgi:tRNA (guanine37-N1)-methyltransferase